MSRRHVSCPFCEHQLGGGHGIQGDGIEALLACKQEYMKQIEVGCPSCGAGFIITKKPASSK